MTFPSMLRIPQYATRSKMTSKIKNWQIVDSTLLHKTRVFDLISRRMRAPEKEFEDDFFHLQCPDWVLVMPITADNKVVMVRQYRHGINAPSLEIPGGIISDPGEAPHLAGRREMMEETGYDTPELMSLGSIHPNPALQSNICYFYLAKNARLVGTQNLDPAEDIEVVTRPLSDLPRMIVEGEITHTLCVTALCYYFLQHGLPSLS